jgi:hypothetical protein
VTTATNETDGMQEVSVIVAMTAAQERVRPQGRSATAPNSTRSGPSRHRPGTHRHRLGPDSAPSDRDPDGDREHHGDGLRSPGQTFL